MKISMLNLLCSIGLLCNFLVAEDEEQLKTDVQSFSEQAGYLMAEDLKKDGAWLDLECFIQGIRKYIANDPSMKHLTNQEHFNNVIDLEYRILTHEAETNLKQSEAYLKQAGARNSAHVLEGGKIVYEIVKPGKGNPIRSMNESVTMRYTLLDSIGNILYRQEKVTCRLEDLLPSFSQALIGMEQGEIRTILIHPELAYGKLGFLHSNSVFIASVEILTAEKPS